MRKLVSTTDKKKNDTMRFFKYTDSKESTHNWLFSNEMEKKPTLI